MTDTAGLELFAVTGDGPAPLPVPAGARALRDLYDGFSLGVYTAFRTFDHRKFLHLDRHLARLADSMQRASLGNGLDEARLRGALDTVCSAYPGAEMRVRVDVLAAPAGPRRARVLIALSPFTPPSPAVYRNGVSVRTTVEIARDDPLAKTADFVNRRASLEARSADAYELLMVDARGRILEGLRSNFYGVRDATLLTVENVALRGVTRGIVLALAEEAAIPTRFDAVRLAEVGGLEEAALSGSSQGLVPIVRIDDLPVADARPGPVVRRLSGLYEAYVAANVAPSV